MNKHEFVTADQLIGLYLLYNKIPWAAVVETTDTDYREALDTFLAKANINISQLPDDEVDGLTLIVTGPEAVLRQLVLDDEDLHVGLWHSGRCVLSNWRE